jgi:hypothetical protein
MKIDYLDEPYTMVEQNWPFQNSKSRPVRAVWPANSTNFDCQHYQGDECPLGLISGWRRTGVDGTAETIGHMLWRTKLDMQKHAPMKL